MFSIFEYLRRRTCDSILAGAYDAAEALEQGPIVETLAAGEIPGPSSPAGAAPQKPAAPDPKKIAAAPSPGPVPSSPAPAAQGNLFGNSSPPPNPPALPPRKRGRPPKNPPAPPRP